MTENQLKIALGVTLIVSHFSILLLSIGLFAAGGFRFEDLTTIVAIVVPMFAGYTTSVIAYVVENRTVAADSSSPVTTVYVVMSFAFPAIFTVLLAAAIVAQAYGKLFSDFEQFKQALILIEGVFAVYVGRFVYSMFERPQAPVEPNEPNAIASEET